LAVGRRLVLIRYLYLPVVTLFQLESFDCVNLEETSGERYLRIDTSFACDTREYHQTRLITGVLFGVNQLIVLAFAYLLHQHRHLINPSLSQQDQVLHNRKHDERIIFLRFLFMDYRPECYWFEIYDLFRRQLFMAVSAFIHTVSSRAIVGIFLAICSAIIIREVYPYQAVHLNMLAMSAQVSRFRPRTRTRE
jgi:hypothetical protein